MSLARTPRVTLFTSIDSIAQALQKAAPWLTLDVVQDPDALSGYGGTVLFESQKLSVTSRDILSRTEILITEPAVLAAILEADPLPSAKSTLPNLQWCQSTYAGVDPLFRVLQDKQEVPTFFLSRFAGKFGPPIAEWCLARIIGHERNFAASAADQENRGWAASRQVTTYRYLSDLTVSILGGCGDIGSTIGRVAKGGFGMRVIAFTKSPRENTPTECWDEVTHDLRYALQNADYIISVLPSTSDTRDLLSDMGLLQSAGPEMGGKSPVLVNVGRGDVISEASLMKALDAGYFSAALLDVFPVEPLPESSPLWGRPNVVVSPHVSGVTRAQDVPDLFLDNYQLYANGLPLKYVVDWQKGY